MKKKETLISKLTLLHFKLMKSEEKRKYIKNLPTTNDNKNAMHLIHILETPKYETEVRSMAADKLGQIQESIAVDALINCFTIDSTCRSYRFRNSILMALQRIGDVTAIPSIVEVLDSYDVKIITDESIFRELKEIIFTLEHLGWKPDSPKRNLLFWLSKKQYDKCIISGVQVLDYLLEIYFSFGDALSNEQVDLLKDIENIILGIGESALMLLMGSIKNTSVTSRSRSIALIGKFKDLRSVSLLKELMLHDNNERICEISRIVLLKNFSNSFTISEIDEALNDERESVKIAAVKGIRQNNFDALIMSLIKLLSDDSMWVRGAVEEVILKFSTKNNTRQLIIALNNSNPLVVSSAAKALGKIKDKDATQSLIERLEKIKDHGVFTTNDYAIREIASSLGSIGGPLSIEPLLNLSIPKPTIEPDQKLRNIVKEAIIKVIDYDIDLLKNYMLTDKYGAQLYDILIEILERDPSRISLEHLMFLSELTDLSRISHNVSESSHDTIMLSGKQTVEIDCSPIRKMVKLALSVKI